jgi:hypothetical protein
MRFHVRVLAIAVLAATVLPLPANSARAITARSWRTDAYAGLGAWVDVYDWSTTFGGSTPSIGLAQIDALAGRGVRTLFLQGAGPRGDAPLEPARQRPLIDRAHANGMRVITWYVPGHVDPDADRNRALAIGSLSVDGLALDIENSTLPDPDERSRRAVRLTAELDAALPGKAIGAIVPSPVGLDLAGGYWPRFPFQGIGAHIDVWVPMTYWSYRNKPGQTQWRDAYAYVSENMRQIRARSKQPFTPFHVIGGLASESTTSDVQGMARAGREQEAIGASLYDAAITPASLWPALADMRLTPVPAAGDNPQSGPGMRRGTTFDLRTTPSTGEPTVSFGFGAPGDVPIVGDWNGDRRTDPGVRRDGSAWYLRTTPTGGPATVAFAFGAAGDVAVAGDWNRDGRTDPGVVRGARSWYLRTSPTSGPPTSSFSFGAPGDVPIVGDWNGDGRSDPGVVRGARWYLRTSLSSGAPTITFSFGSAGDVPIVGDWNGDGRSDPGVIRGGRAWLLRTTLSGGLPTIAFVYGAAGEVPVAGDWN